MVGNDIVDLRDRDADPRRPRERFDARVCRPEERVAIRGAADPCRERWCHWAAKEAAYKLVKKRDPDTAFSPVRFRVDLAAEPDTWLERGAAPTSRAGGVVHGDHRVALSITCADGAVHAIATWSDEGPAGLVHGFERLAAGPDAPLTPAVHSAAARRLARERLADRLGVAVTRLAIAKRGRIPELLLDRAPSGADLSLSHHGGLVAFACRLPAAHTPARLAS